MTAGHNALRGSGPDQKLKFGILTGARASTGATSDDDAR